MSIEFFETLNLKIKEKQSPKESLDINELQKLRKERKSDRLITMRFKQQEFPKKKSEFTAQRC